MQSPLVIEKYISLICSTMNRNESFYD